MKKIQLLLFLFLVAACSPKEENPQRELSRLIIETTPQKILMVETAQSAEEMRTGLMYRKSLPENQGMIFNLKNPRRISMWMKNTYIPLDIIFIDKNYKISQIYKNAEPLSEKLISSTSDVLAVLEVNAGASNKYNFKKGNLVRHAIFNNLEEK